MLRGSILAAGFGCGGSSGSGGAGGGEAESEAEAEAEAESESEGGRLDAGPLERDMGGGGGGRLDAGLPPAGGTFTVLPVMGTGASSETIRAIHGLSADLVYMYSQNGHIYRWDGATWTDVGSDGHGTGMDMWVTDAANVWIARTDGITHFDGTTARNCNPAFDAICVTDAHDLHGIWGADATHVWAVGEGGQIVYWDGSSTSWTHQDWPAGVRLYDVFGFAANDVYAVGDSGDYRPGGTCLSGCHAVILHYDGTMWSDVSTGIDIGNQQFTGIGGSGPDDVWAVGSVTLHFDGMMWTRLRAGGGFLPSGKVWFFAPDDAWSADAFLVRFDGTAWTSPMDAPRGQYQTLWGAAPNDVWFGGGSASVGTSLYVVHYTE